MRNPKLPHVLCFVERVREILYGRCCTVFELMGKGTWIVSECELKHAEACFTLHVPSAPETNGTGLLDYQERCLDLKLARVPAPKRQAMEGWRFKLLPMWLSKILQQDWQDGWVRQGACCHLWQLKFDPQNPHTGKRSDLRSCPLTFSCWIAYMPAHT